VEKRSNIIIQAVTELDGFSN